MLDFRYAVRSLARAKGFAVAVVVTLALGIGANTAVFSVVRGVLLKPLPHRDGDRLMYLRHSMEGAGGENVWFSVPEIEDFRTSSTRLAGIAEYSPMTFSLLGERDAVRIDVGLVTGNYFDVMGLAPVLGRTFDARDDGAGADPVMMLTLRVLACRFGGDTAIVGSFVTAGGRAVEVVGVLQPAPYFPGRIDALMNMVNSEHHLSATMVTGRTHRMTEMIARLAPGATVAEARTEVEAITARVHAEYPEAYDAGSRFRVTLTPFHEVLGQDARLTLWLLMGAAAFVLIIACANVANLTLMRGVRREHELTIRASLGAGTGRLRRLLLTENLVLAGLGGVLGLMLAFAGVGMLAAFAERYSTRASEIRVDGAVLGFTSVLVLIVAIVLSYAPKLASERTIGGLIAAAGRRTTAGARRQRLQQALVVAQIAVSVVLLTGAGLLTRTMLQLSTVDPGLNPENVLTMEVPIDFGAESTDAGCPATSRYRVNSPHCPACDRSRSDPPCRSAAPGSCSRSRPRTGRWHPDEAMPRAEYRTTSPDYFSAAGIPLLEGRDFSAYRSSGWRARGHPQQDAREPAVPRREPDRPTRRLDWLRARVHPGVGRLANGRRYRGRHEGRRPRRAAAAGDVHAVRAGSRSRRADSSSARAAMQRHSHPPRRASYGTSRRSSRSRMC
jgi:putative ABC transport system permease protein